ncbi:MAG: hypothetical protein RL417_1196 [Pseudomonadota bacterium]|jgi:hypothetical protein
MNSARIGIVVILGAVLGACSSTDIPQWKPLKETRTYSVAARQLPPEPTYNRLRWVRPPEVIPSEPRGGTAAAAIVPVMHLEIKDTTLEDVARILASAAQYSSYCSSLIAKQTLTLSRLGTIDELGSEVEKAAQIRVVIDHAGRQVKFLANHAPAAPRLY